jgi:hypothetical protein
MFQERLYIQTRALFALLIFLSAVANVAFLTLDFGSYDVLKSGNALGVFGKMEGATTFFLYTIFPARVVSVALSICMLVVESKKEKGVYRYKVREEHPENTQESIACACELTALEFISILFILFFFFFF